MKIKFLKKLLLLLPIPLIILSFNYFIDPAHLYQDGKYEKGIAKLLLGGKNVANLSNYDERLLQKFLINGLSTRKDVVVIGSSRAMQISSDLFPKESFLNNSVSGACIEDYIAIYELYRKRNYKPTMIILGLDPWMLNKNHGQIRWKSIKGEYLDLAKHYLSLPETQHNNLSTEFIPEKYKELLSFSYFQKSVLTFLTGLNKRNDSYYSTYNYYEDNEVKLCDGSLNYSNKFRTMNIQKIRELAIAYANEKPVYSLGSFDQPDSSSMKKLEAFIRLLSKDNVKIVFFLSPYHPSTYNLLIKSKKYRIIKNVQKYYEELAAKNGTKLIGSYNPADYNITEEEFYDGMHPKKSAIKKILASQ